MKLRINKWIILVAVVAGFMGSFGFAFAVTSPILIPLASVFGISVTNASLISTIMFLGAAVLALPSGMLIDAWGLKKTGILSQCLLLAGWIIGYFSASFSEFLVSRFVMGLGGTMMGVLGAAALVQWFPAKERMISMGLWSTGLPIGIAWGEVLAGIIASDYGWRSVLLVGILISSVCLVVILAILRNGPLRTEGSNEKLAENKIRKGDLSNVFKNKEVWKFNLAVFFAFVPFMAVATYWVPWLMTNKEVFSEVTASGITSMIGVAGIFGTVVSGYIATFLGRSKPVFAAAGIIDGVTLMGFVFVNGIYTLALVSLVVGLSSYMIATMMFAIPPQLVSSKLTGTALGLTILFFYAAGVLGPVIVGDVYSFGSGLLLPGVVMLSCLLISVLFVSRMGIR